MDLSITEMSFVPILNISFRHFCIICSPLLHFCDGTLCFISWYIYMDWSSNRRHVGNVSLSLRLILLLKYLMICVCYFSLKRCLLVVCAFQCIEQRMCFICKVIICSLSFTEIMTYLSYLTYIYYIYMYIYVYNIWCITWQSLVTPLIITRASLSKARKRKAQNFLQSFYPQFKYYFGILWYDRVRCELFCMMLTLYTCKYIYVV